MDLLVSRGHRLEDLTDRYTIDQVDLFVRATIGNLRDERLGVFSGIRLAMHAGPDVWSKFVARFRSPKIKVATREEARELQRMLRHGRD